MKNLCLALIWNACFLELSEDDTVNPDAAVKALEDMASILHAATQAEKTAFAEACVEESKRLVLEAGPEYSKAAEVIAGLPKTFDIDR